MINICIGTEPKTNIPCKVLQYSILQHTSSQVKFHLMEGTHWEHRGNIKEGTGFSLLRWDIPAFFNYQDYAVYLDADQLVLGDIQDLWNYKNKMDFGCIACTYQPDKWFKTPEPNTSVMVMDNAACKNDPNWLDGEKLRETINVDTSRKTYVRIMHAHHLRVQPARLPNDWNSLNVLSQGTKLLHYTQEPKQPWYCPAHAYSQLWGSWLANAVSAGLVTLQEVELEVSRYKPHSNGRRGQGLHPYWLGYLHGNI